LLGCERSGKYRKYRTNLDVSITGTRKCDYPFRLCGPRKSKQKLLERSTKRDPSYFKHVDKIHSTEDSYSTQKASWMKVK